MHVEISTDYSPAQRSSARNQGPTISFPEPTCFLVNTKTRVLVQTKRQANISSNRWAPGSKHKLKKQNLRWIFSRLLPWVWAIEKAGGRRAGSGRERALPADPACRSSSLTERLEQAIAPNTDILWVRHARLRKDGRFRKEDCVTNPKNVCIGGYF